MDVKYKKDMISLFISSNVTNTSADNRNLIFINKKYRFCYLISIFIAINNEINNYFSNINEKNNFG